MSDQACPRGAGVDSVGHLPPLPARRTSTL